MAFDARYGLTAVEVREQKRDARGGWSKGRAMGLKRLAEEAHELDFLSPHDVRAAASIVPFKQYYSSAPRHEIVPDKAALLLVGHPLVFWLDAPDTRVELLAGAPELLIKSHDGQLWLGLQPPVPEAAVDVVVLKETPTRLRVVHIQDEHRRIAAIVGLGLSVPLHAEKQVLQAIGAISSHRHGAVRYRRRRGRRRSDHGRPAPACAPAALQPGPQDADPGAPAGRQRRLLRPRQRRRKRVCRRGRARGAGAARPERRARSAAPAGRQCLVLEQAEEEHGEWLLGQPSLSLQLLVELQELDPAGIVLAWPEGESMRVTQTHRRAARCASISRATRTGLPPAAKCRSTKTR